MTSVLQLNTLRQKDNSRILAGLPRRYFIMDSFEEVAEFLWRYVHLSPDRCDHSLHTFDFTTLYTSLPQDDLTARVCETAYEAFDGVRPHHQSPKGHSPHPCQWEADYVSSLPDRLVNGRPPPAGWATLIPPSS
eukprot:GCRY01007313.1.p1 GENE.GCRY01007313.1~~GCRY01007313.1.p1  ORF type:complete len:134 (-),score=10.52 GCRY01007313.1:334-735(-)